jgi:hypothetical protein
MLRSPCLDLVFLYAARHGGFRIPDVKIHLVLLKVWWRSPTYTIGERRADMYTPVISMRVPDADDETGRENKWRRAVEELRETHRWRLRMYTLIDLCLTQKYHTGRPAHNTTNKIWFVRFLARHDQYC